jgi:hypothetical protein
MTTSPLRFILALSLGVLVSYFVGVFFLSFGPSLFSYSPLEEGVSQDEYIKYVQELPTRGILAICLSCALGAFCGAYFAARIEKIKKMDAALGVGFFLLVVLVFVGVTFSFPLILILGMSSVLLPFCYLAARIAKLN